MPRRLLVTGGAGFMGSSFVRHVVDHTDDRVVVLDKLTYAASTVSLAGLPEDRVSLVVADVCDADAVDGLLDGVDAIVHFAAESHNDNSLSDPRPFVSTNLLGTYTLLEAARRHGTRLHHVSTDEVYGDLPGDDAEPFTPDSPYNPSSPYSATKAGSDLLVRAWTRSFGVPTTISHSSNNYGPYQHVEKFVPRQITNVLRGEHPKLFGTGENVREWLHVDDHSRAVLAILDAGTLGETYLIGSGARTSNLILVQTILALMGRPTGEFDLVADRPGHDRRYALDSSKLRSELGWKPEYHDIREGLLATIRWYQANEPWWSSSKNDVETFYSGRGQ